MNAQQAETTKHTALPWRCKSTGRDGKPSDTHIVTDSRDVAVACIRGDTDHEWQANIELILRAVNSHDDLLAACKALRDIIHDDLTHARQHDHAKAIDAADAAIASAEKAGGAR